MLPVVKATTERLYLSLASHEELKSLVCAKPQMPATTAESGSAAAAGIAGRGGRGVVVGRTRTGIIPQITKRSDAILRRHCIISFLFFSSHSLILSYPFNTVHSCIYFKFSTYHLHAEQLLIRAQLTAIMATGTAPPSTLHSDNASPATGTTALAPAAAAGFRDAAAYDAHRPAYPAAAVERLLDRMGLSSATYGGGATGGTEEGRGTTRRVVEVAAGTGKMTEAMVLGAAGLGGGRLEVLATEPHPEMRRELEGKRLPGVVVREARADELSGRGGVEKGWADGVVAAQAFHW